MNFKKTLCVILVAVTVTCACASCGGDKSGDSGRTAPTTVEYDAEVIADKVKSDIDFEDSLVEFDSGKIEKILGVAPSAYKTAKVYASSTGATPEEIACFEAASSEMATTIKATLEIRLTNQKNTFSDYKPEQAPKLDDAVLEVKDNFVFFIVSGDSAKAKEIIS